ncbi:MAG TPA: phosphoglucosamine mutase, partial [Candidatus Acetothermia bacterium]|nr:phosphoglucosamine mutase [Candidatus Acetothermia bacterium]
YLAQHGFRVVRVPVGDRHVSWTMRRQEIELGGEPAGHIVFGRYAPTGDGLLTALLTLSALHRLQMGLSELVAPVPVYPRVRADVRVRDRTAAMEDPQVQRAIAEAQRTVTLRGRLLVRPSGTQPLIRIMAEGEDEGELKRAVELVRQALASHQTTD